MSDQQPAKIPMAQTVRYFWRHQKKYPGLVFGMFAALPFAVLLNRFLPALIVANILDRLSSHDFVPGHVWGSFGGQITLAAVLWAIGGIGVWRIVSYFNWKLEGQVLRDIAHECFDHLMKLSANFHANHFAGSLVSQSNKLVGAYVRITDTTVYSMGTLLVGLIFTTVILAPRAPLFVAFFILFVFTYVVTAVIATRTIRKFNSKLAASETAQTGYLADSITNVMAIKSFSASKFESDRYLGRAEITRSRTLDLMRVSLRREYVFTSIGTMLNVVALAVAVIGIVVFHSNVATIFLIMSYTNVILLQLWEFSTSTLRTYNRAFGDAEGMMEILATEPDVKDPQKPETSHIAKGAIVFDNVDFTHPDSRQDESLFVGLNLTIKPSEKIGLVGHSGSGKTTLTKLLLRFNDIDNGAILIDGQNIANLRQEDLRRHIAYVPQEPLLFHRSIFENIAYGRPGATKKAVIEAAKKANALDFIEKLPLGFDTLVGERGVKLSGGQRQRIVIARAIIKDAPILVLDEATSALDSESEKLIQTALLELMKGRTTIVIAHRLSTIQRMDRILVLEKGAIVEQGTHQQLVKNKGIYQNLWQHQSGGFLEG